MQVQEDERIDVQEAAHILRLSTRQVRRLKVQLDARLEVRNVVQPDTKVLTVSKNAVVRLKAEREGQPANDMV